MIFNVLFVYLPKMCLYMKFIAINELNEVCFKDDSINIITDKDVLISDEIYAMFFEQQSLGKQFKIKNLYKK